MADQVGLDWPDYFRTLPEDDACALAAWLGAQGLQVGEFMEVVDRAYATGLEHWRGRPAAFISVVGREAAIRYAVRKRHFARLVAMLEEATASGALPGEVRGLGHYPRELEFDHAGVMPVVAEARAHAATTAGCRQSIPRLSCGTTARPQALGNGSSPSSFSPT